jgi:P-type Ca2+ transporter type 2C
MKKYYGNTWLKVVELLESNIYKGLYQYECDIRKNENGDNKIYLPYSRGKVKLILDIFKQKYLYVFLAFIIFFLLNKFNIMAILTILLLLLNLGLKFHHELSKEKEIEILQNLNTSQVLVLREGVERLIEAEDLVTGDIVYFRKNSLIAADIRIIESENIKVDERSITGDKFLKDKYSVKLDGEVTSIGDINNMLFRGSLVKEGSGKGIVVETGNNTQLGKLIRIIDNSKSKKDITINKIEEMIFKIGLCLILIQTILAAIFPGKLIEKKQLFAQGIFAIICIFIPLIITYYGKYIKNKMLEDEIELTNFSSLDLVDNLKIIFLDKVGTITKKELYLDKLYTNEQIYNANSIEKSDINIKRLLDISILCNNAKYNNENNWSKGDMFEISYVKYGVENSIFKANLENKNRRKFEMPRDSNKNMVTTVNKNRNGYRANSRGNLETILSSCTHILINGIEKELTSEDIIKIKLADLNFSKEGLITEGFAYRSFSYEPSEHENVESNLVFVGIMALANPLVDEVADEIQYLIDNEVLPIIFTDDNKISAEVLGRKIGLISSSEQISSGVELDSLSNEEILKVVSKTRIFCKLNPEQKHKIVSLYNMDEYKFAIEGETLGDISLISLAQIGIVKGKISMLLKKIGDIYTEKSSIKAFLKLKEEHKEVENGVNKGVSIYVLTILTEIAFFNAKYFFTNGVGVDEYFIILMNFLLLSPIILINMIYGNVNLRGKKLVIKGILFSIIPVVASYFIKDNYDVIGFLLIGIMLIIDTLVNSKIFKRGRYKGVKLFLISILIYIASIFLLIFLQGFSYSILVIIVIFWLTIIFLLGDIIIKKW